VRDDERLGLHGDESPPSALERSPAVREPTVLESMTPLLVTVSPDTSVSEARRIAEDEGIHHLVVLEDEHLVGVVCEYDLSQSGRGERVGDCMRAPVICIEAEAALSEAVTTMRERAVGCLLVVRSELLLGILTRGDLRRAGVPVEDVAPPGCAACGTDDHVRLDPRTGGTAFCLECLERAASPRSEGDIGGEA